MGWTYPIYVVATLRLKGEHYLGQPFLANSAALTLLAYGVVLAEEAT